MIDSEQVIASIQQDEVPPTWQVFYSKGKRLFVSILQVVGMLICVYFAEPALYPKFSSSTTILLLLLRIAIALVVALLLGMLIKFREEQAKDSVLVVMPDGVVQCTRYSNPAKRTFKVVSYADLSDLTLKPSSQKAGLVIKYSDGRKGSWLMDSMYGRPGITAQNIIASYEKYTATQKSSRKQKSSKKQKLSRIQKS